MISTTSFEALDRLQGHDPGQAESRAKLPEPAISGFRQMRVAKLTIPTDYRIYKTEPSCPLMGDLYDEFERVLVSYPGCEFFAWRSMRDGRIYL